MSPIPIGKRLFDQTFGLIQRSLDLRTARHKVLSSNITNAETPNYQARDIPFERVLESYTGGSPALVLQRTHADHLPQGTTDAVEIEIGSAGVDIDREMGRLAENNIRFQSEIQALVKKLEALRLTIQEVK
jgi:flagellar basal-body rod protein FlgB